MLQYFKEYYRSYGPILIIVTLIISVFYYTVANWGIIRATYRCVNLKNTVLGNLGKCFNSRQGTTCQNTDIGYVYGWCNDANNYGALPGNSTGPYTGYCNQWSWSVGQCPPQQCLGNYPNGIDKQECKLGHKQWGWCLDRGVERAMVGTSCGPTEGKCDKWIWDAKKCPTGCFKSTPIKKEKSAKCPKKSGKCQLVCGSRDDGNVVGCPPPNCDDQANHTSAGECDKCICRGPPKDPWKPYENRQISIGARDGKAKNCRLTYEPQSESESKSESESESKSKSDSKSAKFSCGSKVASNIGPLLLEKSRDEKYRLIDSDGCTLRYSDNKGGPSLGSEERTAIFDCTGNAGEPLEIEGTPDNARIYTDVKGKRCGLQWSSVLDADGKRLAKFDCHDQADRVVVDMV